MSSLLPLAVSIPDGRDLAQYVFAGLAQGCVYALMALAFVTIAKVTQVYNFALGEWIMFGGMIAVAGSEAGLSTPLFVLCAVLGVLGIAVLQERLTVAPVRGRVDMLSLVVGSLGVGVLLRGVALAIWGKDPRSIPGFEQGTFTLLGARLDYQVLWIWAGALVALMFMIVLFRFTRVGWAMRACAIDPIAARLHGIPLARLSILAFALGGALSGLMGALTVPLTGVSWNSGLAFGLIGFIAAALARFDSAGLAVVYGLGLGVVQILAAGVVSAAYSDAMVYGVLIVYLVARGLAGDEGALRRLAHRRVTARERTGSRPATTSVLPSISKSDAGGRRQPLPQRGLLVAGVIAVAALAVPTILGSNPQAMDSAVFILLSAIGATGLGLALGLAGQFTMGQAGFYLVSGYAVGILTAKAGWGVVPAFLVAIGLSGIGGMFIGWLTVRLAGFALAIATLAFHLILLVVVVQFTSLTGGPTGITGMTPFRPFGIDLSSQTQFYFVCLAALAVCLLVAHSLAASRVGRMLRALAADQEAAESMGLNAARLRVGIVTVASAMAGVGGGLWSAYLQYAAPSSWDFNLMVALITYVIVGGVGSVYGGALGAVVVGGLQFALNGSVSVGVGGGTSATQVVFNGVLIIAFVLIFRQGLVGLPAQVRGLIRRQGRTYTPDELLPLPSAACGAGTPAPTGDLR